LDPELVKQAERVLVVEAGHHDARELRLMGRRLLEGVAPDLPHANEAKLLAKEEAAALAACRLTMVDDGHGQTHGRFTIPTLHGPRHKKALRALAAPRHQTATHGPGAGEQALRRPGPERLGRAF